MQISVKINGLNELVSAFERAPTVVQKSMELATRKSARNVAEYARKNHNFTTRTGLLEKSIVFYTQDWPPKAVIYVNPLIAPYGAFVHYGTKDRVEPIRPVHKKALRWVSAGQFVFSKKVKHRGLKPDQFLYQALDNNRAKIQAIFDRHISDAIKEVGI